MGYISREICYIVVINHKRGVEHMNEVVIKPSLREQFLQGWAQCRVIFFSAPCGFGKSTAATALLSNHKTCVFSAEDPEFLREPVPKNVDAIVIDSLPALKDPEDQQTLCAWIRENPELHFVILSRGVAARLAHAVPLYGAFAAHRGQRSAV